MRIFRAYILFLFFILTGCATPIDEGFKKLGSYKASQKILTEYGPEIEKRLKPAFDNQKINYPPHRLAILGFKYERRVEVWAKNRQGDWKYIKRFPLLATSGKPGPKLLLDDEQIPEGLYKISYLNPLSQLHLSMKLNYPNAFDRYFAKLDHRKKLGGDIFIHGKRESVGCLAIGDIAIEELYVLAARTGLSKIEVIIAPNDLRVHKPLNTESPAKWVSKLDRQLEKALRRFT